MQNLRPQRGKLQHFIIGNIIELDGSGNFPRISRIDAIYIRIDLAQVSMHGSRDSHSAGVGTAPSQRGHVAVTVYALKSCNHHDSAFVDFLFDTGDVELDETHIEGMVSLREMEDDLYQFDENRYEVSNGNTVPPNSPIIINPETSFFFSGMANNACENIIENTLELPKPIMAMQI